MGSTTYHTVRAAKARWAEEGDPDATGVIPGQSQTVRVLVLVLVPGQSAGQGSIDASRVERPRSIRVEKPREDGFDPPGDPK